MYHLSSYIWVIILLDYANSHDEEDPVPADKVWTTMGSRLCNPLMKGG